MISATGAVRLDVQRLRDLDFDRYGLASLAAGDRGLFYVNRAGRTAPVALMDGWAEDFSDGLARSPRGAKTGFIDRSLRLAIPARYDGAYPFEHGRAAVCLGCKVSAPDREGYTFLKGGRWGCIDTDGREVVPVTQPSPDNLDCAGN